MLHKPQSFGSFDADAVMKPGEPIPVLLTKIQPPRSFAGLLDRPRLLSLLPLVRSKQLTVVKAPAGFGKTSIAVAWAEHLRQKGSVVAWLGLDPDDNEPSRFVYYVAHALRRAREGLASTAIDMIAENSLLPPGTVASTLINEIAELDDDVYLFLDDYHLIADGAIHDRVFFFLRHASANFHLVLTTRTEPSLPLARLRVQNQLLEVDASALRFDLVETRRFLEQEQVRGFSPSDLRILHSTTDGWAAALRLIASASLQGEGGLQPLLQSTPGASRPIGAYI
jgi:LuxR family maltose regulon positive regulatory protein